MINYNLLIGANPDFLGFFSSIYSDWAGIAVALLILSAIIIGLVYMIGGLISNDKIKAFGKVELVEILYSCVILFMTVNLIGLATNLAYGLSNDNDYSKVACGPEYQKYTQYQGVPCHIILSMDYLNSLFNEGQDISYGVYSNYIITGMLSEMSINLEVITIQTGVFSYNPLKGFFVVGNVIKAMVFDYLVKIMTIAKFQEVFLRFIAIAAFPVFFTIGLVLRTFFFTRKLGGLLMAFSLSLFFIFPMFYIFGGIIFNNLKGKSLNAGSSSAIQYVYEDLNGLPGFIQFDTNNPSGKVVDISAIKSNAEIAYGSNSLGSYGTSQFPSDLDSELAKLNICKTSSPPKDDDTVKAMIKEGDDKAASFLDFLQGKNLYNKAAFLVVAEPGGYIDSASRLAFFSLFFSFLSIMATIAATKSLSGLLGGDTEIAGLTHLI